MGQYIYLVNHEEKILCEACKQGSQGMLSYFDSDNQKLLIPVFIGYCVEKGLSIEYTTCTGIEANELYAKGYRDFGHYVAYEEDDPIYCYSLPKCNLCLETCQYKNIYKTNLDVSIMKHYKEHVVGFEDLQINDKVVFLCDDCSDFVKRVKLDE